MSNKLSVTQKAFADEVEVILRGKPYSLPLHSEYIEDIIYDEDDELNDDEFSSETADIIEEWVGEDVAFFEEMIGFELTLDEFEDLTFELTCIYERINGDY